MTWVSINAMVSWNRTRDEISGFFNMDYTLKLSCNCMHLRMLTLDAWELGYIIHPKAIFGWWPITMGWIMDSNMQFLDGGQSQ